MMLVKYLVRIYVFEIYIFNDIRVCVENTMFIALF